MSDPRKPDAILSFRVGDIRHKLELFASYQFDRSDMQVQPQHDERGNPTVRVRHNGLWLPPGQRQLLKLEEVMDMVSFNLGRALGAQNAEK